jgi:hypothetical protein
MVKKTRPHREAMVVLRREAQLGSEHSQQPSSDTQVNKSADDSSSSLGTTQYAVK